MSLKQSLRPIASAASHFRPCGLRNVGDSSRLRKISAGRQVLGTGKVFQVPLVEQIAGHVEKIFAMTSVASTVC